MEWQSPGRIRQRVQDGEKTTILWPKRSALALDADRRSGFWCSIRRQQPYFCAEPVSHCTDAFNLAAQGHGDTGMLMLEPGASLSATVRLRPSLG
jgi:aldose 1-epimerase